MTTDLHSSLEELPPLDWPVVMSVGAFSQLLIDFGWHHLEA